MGGFKISSTSNSISAVFEGLFTVDDARFYIESFKKEAAKVNTANCNLILDGSNLKELPTEMQEILKNILVLYKSMGFNNVILDSGNNEILKTQVKRIVADAGLTEFSLI